MAVVTTSIHTSFTTPFWATVAGIAAVAAAVAHLSSPSPEADGGSLAHTLAAIDRHTPTLADVVVPDSDDDLAAPPVAVAARATALKAPSVQPPAGVREARAHYAAEVARILADPRLNESQQQQRLMALRTSLPPEVAAAEFGGSAFSLAMEKQVAEMRARGESDDEVLHLRRQFVDAEGAKSVVEMEREQLDTERQIWALRHPAFIRERDQLYAAALGVPETHQRLEHLLRTHFSAHELERARQLAGL